MKLSEAIELGSTLIVEDRSVYYVPSTPQRNCPRGCALGSAWAAIGRTRYLVDRQEIANIFPICNIELSEHEAKLMGLTYHDSSLTFVISALHSSNKVPRLEIARRVRLIEDLHPEIPGYEPHEEARGKLKCIAQAVTTT